MWHSKSTLKTVRFLPHLPRLRRADTLLTGFLWKYPTFTVLEPGAIIKEVVALHVTIGHFKLTQRASVSTQIAELRRLLLGIRKGDSVDDDASLEYFALAGQGEIPLVINAWKADTIASSILLKREVEVRSKKPLKFIMWAFLFHVT